MKKKITEKHTIHHSQADYEFLQSVYLALVSADSHRHYDIYEVDRLFNTAERLTVKFLETAFQKGWMPICLSENEQVKNDGT